MFLIFADSETNTAQLVGIIVSGICTIIGAVVAGYIAIIQAKEKAKAQERFDESNVKRDALSCKLDDIHAQIQPLIEKESAMRLPKTPNTKESS